MSIDVNPDWWKSLFDDLYLLTDARTIADDELTKKEVDILCQLLPLQDEDKILDLCGGQGRHSLELATRGFNGCTVLDYSDVLLAKGRATAAEKECRLEFVQGDAKNTNLEGASFDHVMVLGNSLGYLPHPADDLQILLEAGRLLRPGGWLLLDVTDGNIVRERFAPNAWHEIDEGIVVCRQRQLDDAVIKCREVVLCKEQGLLRDQTYAIRTYGAERLEHLVSEAGFSGVSVQQGFASSNMKGDYGFMNHRLLVRARKQA